MGPLAAQRIVLKLSVMIHDVDAQKLMDPFLSFHPGGEVIRWLTENVIYVCMSITFRDIPSSHEIVN